MPAVGISQSPHPSSGPLGRDCPGRGQRANKLIRGIQTGASTCSCTSPSPLIEPQLPTSKEPGRQLSNRGYGAILRYCTKHVAQDFRDCGSPCWGILNTCPLSSCHQPIALGYRMGCIRAFAPSENGGNRNVTLPTAKSCSCPPPRQWLYFYLRSWVASRQPRCKTHMSGNISSSKQFAVRILRPPQWAVVGGGPGKRWRKGNPEHQPERRGARTLSANERQVRHKLALSLASFMLFRRSVSSIFRRNLQKLNSEPRAASYRTKKSSDDGLF